LVQLAGEITPYVTAAASAYGAAVLTQTQEEAATATVAFGRRMAQRIFGTGAEGEEMPEALADVIEDSEDGDNRAALRKAIRKALEADADLAAEAERVLHQARQAGAHVTTFGPRSSATQTNSGIIATGDNNNIFQG
jgi:predicted nucleotide-binding protein (sugar kinase/HSP70/actin superfamily)